MKTTNQNKITSGVIKVHFIVLLIAFTILSFTLVIIGMYYLAVLSYSVLGLMIWNRNYFIDK